jgi:alpha-beta hydrolase superfamily lysophospholipase
MPDVRAAVLSAPALGIHLSGLQAGLLSTLPFIAPNLCLDNGIDARHLCRDPAVVQAYLKDPRVHRKISIRLAGWMLRASQQLDQLAQHWTIPLLLLLAGHDRLVDNKASERFASLVSPDLLTVHREAAMSHEMLHDPEKDRVLHKIADWMDLAVTRVPEAF